MSTSGHLKFQGTNRATFVGETSNIMFDTTTTSLGIGVTGTDHPSSNLYITGNAYVSSNIAVGGVLTMGTVNVVARHDLEAVTALGNTTPLTIEFSNATTGIATTSNVEVGGELTVNGNATISSNLIVDDSGASGNSRLAIGTTNLTHGIVVRKNTDTLLLESESAGATYPVNIDFKNYDDQNPVGARISAIDDTVWGSHLTFHTKVQDGNNATSAITEKMRILSNGNVGIGASVPNRLLHVETPTGTSENYIKIASGMNNGSAQSISGIEFQTNPQFYNGDNGVRTPARITSGFLNGPAGTANWADAYLSLLSTTSASNAALTEYVTCRGSKVGIFTTSPQAELDVRTKLIAGDYGSSGYYNTNSRIHARNNNSTQITMENIGTMTGGIGVMSSGTVVGSQGDVLMRGGSTHTADFGSTGSYMGVFKHSGGDIVQFFKDRNGQADYFYYNTSGNYGHYSDRRGKTNIEPLNMSESVQYIKNLKPISFNYHNDPTGEHPQAGFIAQDVLAAQTNIAQTHAVVNNHKTYDENDPNCKELGISMHNIIPMITHTLQNILERLETLENKNA